MSGARDQGVVGRRLLAGLLVVSAVLHTVVAVRFWPSVPAGLAVVVAVAAVGVAVAVVAGAHPQIPLAGVLVGAAGAAVFLLPALFAAASGGTSATVLDGWAIAAFLADTVVARLGAATLRRGARAPHA